jgi:hypothetical protein
MDGNHPVRRERLRPPDVFSFVRSEPSMAGRKRFCFSDGEAIRREGRMFPSDPERFQESVAK